MQVICGDEIQQVLGGEKTQQIAQELGASGQEVPGSLVSLFPEIIDKLIPNGKCLAKVYFFVADIIL
jgi:uncharacterized protein YidB (DUF937 family)